MSANERQVGGKHYMKYKGLQYWDVVHQFNLDYFQGNVLKYLLRWKDKNGLEDLRKALHYLEKYIELMEQSNQADEADEADVFVVKLGEVSPGGWSGFKYEGGTGSREEYTCRKCLSRVGVPVGTNPNRYHECGKNG